MNISEIEKRRLFAMKNGHCGSAGYVLIERDIPALIAHVRELERQVKEMEAGLEFLTAAMRRADALNKEQPNEA